MNDTAIKNYCIWARNELAAGVEARMRLYGVAEGAEPAGAAAVGGRALSPEETGWRDALLRAGAEEGFEHLRDRAAYTWFNRIAAVRYMEVHDFLPSRVRMFTRPAADGSWELGSQAADEALDVEIEGADPVRVAELKQAGEDGPLFRYLFLAQCAELSGCLPGVFQPVDACMALLLPANLMDPDGVVGRMVGDIPEEDWRNVQILGWMYQHYNSEVKDAFFASKAKETPDTIGPATQLFTPDWIVRYMVQNSLGRLWMLNNPGSPLRGEMEYYVEPDSGHEDFIRIGGPEDISLCDPACGSGHILVYAFELLSKMYLERGYREREIPGLVLSKNLHGMEIDPRAAQIARLALAMCARGMDRRFFGRGVQADIAVLAPVALGEGDVPRGSALEKRKDLLDALAHLDEAGSLLAPGEADLAAIREAVALAGDGGLFGSSSRERLRRALDTCEVLSRRHDCVVANPPYMGSSSFGPFMSRWVKKGYPDVKSDLFSSFVVRMFDLAKDHGECGVMSPFVWMFIGSYEKLRNEIIDNRTLTSLIQLEYSGFAGATVPICTYTFHNSFIKGYKGGYVRLSNFVGASVQAPKALEAIKNPDCGWFYRRDAETFRQIPGTPIAYWLSESYGRMFELGTMKSTYVSGGRLKTHDNEKYVRNWWEVPASLVGDLWMPLSNGGGFSRWSGMKYDVVNWSTGASDFYSQHGGLPKPGSIEKRGICWGLITSGRCSFRVKTQGELFTSGAPTVFIANQDNERALSIDLAFLNSSIASELLDAINPTLNTTVGDVLSLPMPPSSALDTEVIDYADQSVSIADVDWDSFETSWDFKRHPLV